ncbi:sensor histidine kinase [Paenibacillus sp. strain BS8-2]
MRNIRGLFVDAKIRTKFLFSFAVMILITVLVISGINYWVSVGVIKRNSNEFSQYLIGQIGINIAKTTTDIEGMTFQQFRNSSLSTVLGQISESEVSNYAKDKYINDFLTDLLFLKDYYLSVLIIDVNDKEYSIERKPMTGYNDKILEKSSIATIQENRGRATWFRGDDDMLFMTKALYDIETSKYVGILALSVESSYISDILTDVHNLMDGDIMILNENNELFVKGNHWSEAAQHYLDQDMYMVDSTQRDFEYAGKHFISNMLSTDYDKWKIVQIIDVDHLTRGTESIQYWTISTLIVALLFAFLMAARISKNMTENIRLLHRGMSSFSLDMNHQAIIPRSRDEVGLLTIKFNSMAEKINELFSSVYREKLLKQKAEYRTLQFEYKALQAQMNPHFLYNTLETIHSLAKIKGENEIGDLIYLLGKLLRESIRKKGDHITIQEEIEFINDYLSIHKRIYVDRIEVVYELDDRLADCQVPKFILQPLVENAIIYGIEEKPGKSAIHISSYQVEGDLCLAVTDNGIGMDEETVRRILDPAWYESQNGTNKHTNVGVMSIQKRIRILYGDQYGLTITSEIGVGTTVCIRLPVDKTK